jgi:hypothetical protein
MSVTSHVNALKGKHKRIESLIHEEAARPLPDFARITMLKKKRLLIKEEMNRLFRIDRAQVNAS